MRLQCRVSPAHSELLAHLETITPEYRAKRVIELANMMVTMISSGFIPHMGASPDAPTLPLQGPALANGNQATLDNNGSPRRPAPGGADLEQRAMPPIDDTLEGDDHGTIQEPAAEQAAIARSAPSWIKGAKLKS